MSAWIVSKRHIDALVTGLLEAGIVTESERTPDEIGTLLWHENQRSVRHLYSGKDAGARVTAYHYAPNQTGRAALVNACDCYEYQSCEHEGWEASEAKALIDTLRGSISGDLPAFRQCQAYRDAPWGID